MNELEMRKFALETASATTSNWGDAGALIKNAQQFEDYINGKYSTTSDVETPTSLIESLKITHPTKGLIPFRLYNHQKMLWSAIDNNKTLIVNTARQMGSSTLLAAYALKYALEHENVLVRVISNRFSTAKTVGFMFKEQTKELRGETNNDSTSVLSFKNRSRIVCQNTVDFSHLSPPEKSHLELDTMANLLIIDNAAFIPYAQDDYVNQLITQQVSDKCVMLSSANEDCGLFYTLWNVYSMHRKILLLPWYVHEKLDRNWEKGQRHIIGSRFENEYCCQFRVKH